MKIIYKTVLFLFLGLTFLLLGKDLILGEDITFSQLKTILIGSISMSVLALIVLLLLSKFFIAFSKKEVTKHGVSNSFSKTLQLFCPDIDALVLNLASNLRVKGWKLLEKKMTDEKIVFLTKRSKKSFGERIEIVFSSRADDLYTFSLRSDSSYPRTLIDYGKNEENVLYVESLLKELADSKLKE